MNEDVMLRADEKKINWYPGHMARAKRALADQLSRVDVVVELCDARIPRASRNPDLADMIKNKRHLLVLGKADLADERETRAWLGYFRAQGIDCMSFDSIRGKAKDIIARIEKASADAVAKMAAKGVKKTVRVMIVGVPNVGKSTFTNRINGASIARTGDRPGVTRSNQWVRITPYLELLDTPGLLWPNLSDQQDARALEEHHEQDGGGHRQQPPVCEVQRTEELLVSSHRARIFDGRISLGSLVADALQHIVSQFIALL